MKITFNSPVILIFSAICAGVFCLSYLNLDMDLFVLMPVWDMDNPLWYFRIFSHVVGHASAEHLMGNLAFILLLGPIIEEKYGSKNTAIMLFSTALLTGLVHTIFFNTGLLGASGIVFMLILLVSLVNFKKKEIPLTFLLIVIVYIGKEFMGAFSDDQVAHSTHIIGGIIGALFGFSLGAKGGKKSAKTEPISLLK